MSIQLHYQHRDYALLPGETVLDALLRQGVNIPFSCRHGVCQSCLMRSYDRSLPAESKQGLAAPLLNKHYFLACLCRPQTELDILPAQRSDLVHQATLIERERLAEDIWRVAIRPERSLDLHVGQYLCIYHHNESRCYSVVSRSESGTLHFHVRLYPNGKISPQLCAQLPPGSLIELGDPRGDCFYSAEKRSAELLLVATGTGLANCYGNLAEALRCGHQGKIVLLHGGRSRNDLYLHEQLKQLSREVINFFYHPCLSQEQCADIDVGRVNDFLPKHLGALESPAVYIAGSSVMVNEVQRICLAANIPPDAIRTDNHGAPESAVDSGDTPYPQADLELWQALDQGRRLAVILDEFYDRVFEDPILSPYFHNSSKQRAKEKVFSFYRRLFSGEKVYFGDRPRNAHHWMIISDQVFDYREALLTSLLKKHGLSDALIAHWCSYEEHYRRDIVKQTAWGRRIGSVEAPSDGFGCEVLSVGAVCDACQQGIEAGTQVRYHLRTGQIYCPGCSVPA